MPEILNGDGGGIVSIADLTAAFYNVVSLAVEDYGGNAERLYTYVRGACDLVDAVAALLAGGEDE